MPSTADYQDALKELKGRQKDYATYRNYFDGKQPLSFATDQWDVAFGGLFKRLSYNRCRSVVDAFANRLIVTGWETPGIKELRKKNTASDAESEEVDDKLGNAAQAIWDRNRMHKRQGELIAEAMRAGDAYVIVWPGEDGNARLDINRGHLVYPVYDDEYPERLSYAVKCWRVHHGEYKGKWRVNVYEPDVITRWVTRSTQDQYPEKFERLIPFEDSDPAEIVNEFGEVPVFHFGNNADTGSCGVSELVDVIPLQDGVNKSVADMLIAGEYVSFPQRWAVGVAPTTNPYTNKEEEQFKAAVDRLWAVDSPEAKFGQFDPANMAQYTDSQDAWDLKISRVSFVPVHWLSMSGEFPSGESLKTAEGPFTSKLKDRQTAFGDTLGDMMAFALRVEGATQDDVTVTPIWTPAETRSEKEALEQAAMKRTLSIPDTQIWAELGYSQQEIAEFTAAAEQKRQQQLEQFSRSFDRGEAPVGG